MLYTFTDKKHGHSFNVAYSTICTLANSQGIYSRMRAELEAENWKPLYDLTIDNYFEDALDFILFIEQQPNGVRIFRTLFFIVSTMVLQNNNTNSIV